MDTSFNPRQRWSVATQTLIRLAAEQAASRRRVIFEKNNAGSDKSQPIQCAGCGANLAPPDTSLPFGVEYSCGVCSSMSPAESACDTMKLSLRLSAERAHRLRTSHAAIRAALIDTGINARATFRNYVPTTDSQRVAAEAVRTWVGKPTWCLLLAGPPGVGKTHLATARWRRSLFRCARKGKPLPTFIRENQIAREWRTAFRNRKGESPDEVLESYAAEPLLFVDDLGVVPTGEGWFGAMSQLIAYREQYRLPTLITTNLSAPEIAKTYGDRMTSRLSSGRCVRVDGPDARSRAA